MNMQDQDNQPGLIMAIAATLTACVALYQVLAHAVGL